MGAKFYAWCDDSYQPGEICLKIATFEHAHTHTHCRQLITCVCTWIVPDIPAWFVGVDASVHHSLPVTVGFAQFIFFLQRGGEITQRTSQLFSDEISRWHYIRVSGSAKLSQFWTSDIAGTHTYQCKVGFVLGSVLIGRWRHGNGFGLLHTGCVHVRELVFVSWWGDILRQTISWLLSFDLIVVICWCYW